MIVEDFSTRIFRKNRIGLIGPNGAGKTTLLKMLIGELEPDTGTVKLGANLLPVVIDQRRIGLDPDKTPWEILADRNDHVLVRGHPTHVMTYLREYLFRDEQARQPVRTLSGGERNRLLLAKALAAPSNLLVLDEPTNDLDADTLDLLQEALADYDGTVLLVSHDRDFLDRLVTSTIALEGDGTAIEYAGGYSDYVSQRGPREEPTGVTPSRAQGEGRAAPARETKARLGYKRERALVELPKKIEALQAEMAAINEALGRSRPLQPRPQGLRRQDRPSRRRPGRDRRRRDRMAGTRDAEGRAARVGAVVAATCPSGRNAPRSCRQWPPSPACRSGCAGTRWGRAHWSAGPSTPVMTNCVLGNFSPSMPMKGIVPPSPM